ncbi:MAG: DUF4338 domain-containing protein [Betaproteobacteria bacterium]|nr:DUF4338 domain-containing protein [Betaproteobacteria bacterium]
MLTNNTRFLVLSWVEVPHLASHMLAGLARRIRADWQSKYGHPIHALESAATSSDGCRCVRARKPPRAVSMTIRNSSVSRREPGRACVSARLPAGS